MPFLPTFNDLKSVSLSINPLNLFSDSKSDALTTDDGVGKAGPGPSSLANRTGRPSLKSDSSSSDSFKGHERRKSGVMIHEEERPKREKKKKVQMDSYIIVKPPPANSKNPLHLQVQLVVGKTSGRPRSDSTATNGTGTGSRAPSLFSDPASARTPSTPPLTGGSRLITPSAFPNDTIEGLDRRDPDSPASSDDAFSAPSRASTSGLRQVSSRKSSAASIPTSMTSTVGQKRIQPMFNLNLQSVMHSSVVTDAGTDAKVAKFGKRQLDIHDIGILEPTEIWQVPSNASTLFPPMSALEESKSRPMSMYSLGAPISPSVTRNGGDEHGRGRASIDLLRPEILQEGGASAKRFFGKIGGAFKKKNGHDKEGSSQSTSTLHPSPTPNTGAFPASTGMARGGSKEGAAAHGSGVGPPTFGCSPHVVARRSSLPRLPSMSTDGLAPPDTASASITSPSKPATMSNRPVAYSWTVKRWAKRNTEGWAANLVEAVSHGVTVQGAVPGEGEDEVIFEWSKARPATTITPRSRRSSIASRGHSRPPSTTTHTEPTLNGNLSPTPTTPGLSARPAPVRRISATSSLSPHKTDSATLPDDCSAVYHTAEEDDSDPEDSETPWTCSLIIVKTGEVQVVGTLTPAPHHPRVVGQLKLPSKLETLCLANLDGGAEHVDKAKKAVCLSDGAVKDVVCVTALWLVAREGWNGLGKLKRGR